MSLAQKQANMKERHSNAVREVNLHRGERMPRPRPEFIGPKTRKTLLHESLSTRARELRAKLDQLEERKREQHERHYAVPLTIVPREELEWL